MTLSICAFVSLTKAYSLDASQREFLTRDTVLYATYENVIRLFVAYNNVNRSSASAVQNQRYRYIYITLHAQPINRDRSRNVETLKHIVCLRKTLKVRL
jgi:hypothetical protein